MATVERERSEGTSGGRFVCCAPFCPESPLERDCTSCPAAAPATLLTLVGRVFLRATEPQPTPAVP